VSAREMSKRTIKAVGDPHMTNILGQKFDLAMPGNHVMVRLPKGAQYDALLQITCKVKRMSASCADTYIQDLNITGSWVEQRGDAMLTFSAQHGHLQQQWMDIGKVQVKVVRGTTKTGIKYLNMFTKHLSTTGLMVGGILGEDDHTAAATPTEDCRKVIEL